MSEITQTTSGADCCNGPTNRYAKCFKTKPRENYFDWHKKCNTIYKPVVRFYTWKQLLLSASLSHHNSVRPSVCHTGESVKKGAK